MTGGHISVTEPRRVVDSSAFFDAVARSLERCGGVADPPALIYIDLDRFTETNDSLGRTGGDAVLAMVAGRLGAAAPPGAVVGRVGGDEFAVLLPGPVSVDAARRAAAALRTEVEVPLRVGHASIRQRASAGVALAEDAEATADDLVRDAETAARRARRRGGAAVEVFGREARMQRRAARDLRTALERAIADDTLEVAFQPIVELSTAAVGGLEALVRWNHPELGELPPARFLPIAEEAPLSAPLGARVLDAVPRHVAAWRHEGLFVPPVCVNVSGRELADPGFAARLQEQLAAARLAPESVVIEMTEQALGELGSAAVGVVEELRAAGLKAWLDEFGVGGLALQHLQHVPVEGLKIDRSLIAALPDDDRALAIVRGILEIGQAVGVRVVAVGVETADQATLLRAIGCPLGQGFHLCRPLSPDGTAGVLEHGLPHAVALTVEDRDTMTLSDAAQALGVSTATVRRWSDAGRIGAVRTAGGHRRLRRVDVEREAARRLSGPVVRQPRLPSRGLPRAGAEMTGHAPHLVAQTVRSVYVGDRHGWAGTPGGRLALERWVRGLGEALGRGDFDRALEATRDVMSAARGAGVPLLERISLVDSLGQTVWSALSAAGAPAEELADLGRTVAMLRRVLVQDAESPAQPRRRRPAGALASTAPNLSRFHRRLHESVDS